MESKHLISILESLLFVANKPIKAKDFAAFLQIEEPETLLALENIKKKHEHAGIVLIESDGEYQFVTNSVNSTQVKNFLNIELREKLTDATVEVLAIIAYRQPISKAEIEAIRGVNSQYSIRNLLVRGLIEKISNPNDLRSFLYKTTAEFLQHLGLTAIKDLPAFEELVTQIKLPQNPEIKN